MIRHVYERARRARLVGRVVVATDDDRIAAAVRAFGGEVVLTSPAHASGTDRLAEAVQSMDARIVVNVQGDEPMLDPDSIDRAAQALLDDPDVPLATLSVPFRDEDEFLSRSAVKVVVDAGGHALYFSRSPIPCVRDAPTPGDAARLVLSSRLAARHVGLYVYRREALLRLAALPKAPLEEAEGLEQLRALHHGLRLRVAHIEAPSPAVAVDTPEDLLRVRALLAEVSPLA
jgi:3-deoxy-manno-octulosonate cytidylyltransferase (CMP-KDO synthetase)